MEGEKRDRVASVTLTPSEYAALRRLAEESGQTVSRIVGQLATQADGQDRSRRFPFVSKGD